MVLNARGLHQMVKRGLDPESSAWDQFVQAFSPDNDFRPDTLETWEIVLLIVEPILFYLAFALTQYTMFDVLPALVMIEQPTTVVVTEVGDNVEPDSPLEKAPLLDEEVIVVRKEPVTSSIRASLRYLKTVGGLRGQYRGFWASVFYHISHGLAMHLLLALTSIGFASTLVMTFVCHMAATVMLSRLHMTWTHIVISSPSPLPWYKRVPRGCFAFRSVALSSLGVAIAHQLVVILPAVTFFAFGGVGNSDGSGITRDLAFRGLAVLGVGLTTAFFVLLPASMHLTRVEASLLPADVDTIVPFDRTMGGRVSADSKSLHRSRAVRASITRGDKMRVIKYYLKAVTLVALHVVFMVLAYAVLMQTMGLNRVQATVQKYLGEQHEAHPGQGGDFSVTGMMRMVKM